MSTRDGQHSVKGKQQAGDRSAGRSLAELRNSLGPYAIGAIFLLLAGWFMAGPRLLSLPHTEPVLVARDLFTSDPMRAGPTDPPTIWRGGYDLPCMDCHRLLPPPREPRSLLTQHTEIVLDHGLNDRCYNCHDRFDRNRLVIAGGQTISFEDTPRLCATCHGPTYRDWELGIHGRTTGSWLADDPAHGRLTCTQCHDPHAPAFAPMTLLPGPNTIRMGPRHVVTHDYESGSPLKRWKIALKEQAKADAELRSDDDPSMPEELP